MTLPRNVHSSIFVKFVKQTQASIVLRRWWEAVETPAGGNHVPREHEKSWPLFLGLRQRDAPAARVRTAGAGPGSRADRDIYRRPGPAGGCSGRATAASLASALYAEAVQKIFHGQLLQARPGLGGKLPANTPSVCLTILPTRLDSTFSVTRTPTLSSSVR